MEPFKTPILFLIFNRPDLSVKVFKRIREVKPKKLYIAADGPRNNSDTDNLMCQKTRTKILEMIDWDCSVIKLFRDKNLGSGRGVSEAISWMFNNEKRGIIIEDDILVSNSFFRFCEILLHHYEEDKRVFGISGLNWQDGKKRGKGSYYFSKYPGTWGWATWANRWENFRFAPIDEVKTYIAEHRIDELKLHPSVKQKIISEFQTIGHINSAWDYAWRYTVFKNSGLIAVPQVNLSSNQGFGNDATHTIEPNKLLSNKTLFEIEFPLIHPEKVVLDKNADKYIEKKFFLSKKRKIVNLIKRIFHVYMQTI